MFDGKAWRFGTSELRMMHWNGGSDDGKSCQHGRKRDTEKYMVAVLVVQYYH